MEILGPKWLRMGTCIEPHPNNQPRNRLAQEHESAPHKPLGHWELARLAPDLRLELVRTYCRLLRAGRSRRSRRQPRGVNCSKVAQNRLRLAR